MSQNDVVLINCLVNEFSEICFSKLAPAFDLNSCFLHHNWINYLKRVRKENEPFPSSMSIVSISSRHKSGMQSTFALFITSNCFLQIVFGLVFFQKVTSTHVFMPHAVWHIICHVLYIDIVSCTHHWRQMKNSCIGKPSFHWFSGTQFRLAWTIPSYFWMKALK